MKKIFILIELVVLVGLSVYTYFTIKQGLTSPVTQTQETKEEKSISHISCSDIRQSVEENGKIYIACYGGVLVVDKSTGKVEKQITMDKGLSDFVTTGIIKKGDVLYIGTQDGLTIWDLSKNTGTKLSVGEGLPNGANILIEEDGKYIWIGTFDGLARLDTETKQLQTFRNEIAPNEGEKLNVTGIAVTDKYVYFSVVASAFSSGSVARYNKETSEWKKFTAADLQDVTQYARVDAMGICNLSDGTAFVEDKTIWKIADEESAKPTKIFTATYNDSVEYNILCSGNNILFVTSKSKFVYDGEKVRNFDATTDLQLDLAYTNRKNSTDFKKLFGDSAPGAFYQLLGSIEDNVYIAAYTGFWVYNVSKDTLTQLYLPDKYAFDSLGNFIFWPVEGTDKFVVAQQSCGMGCDEPKFYTCSYPGNQCASLKISDEAMKVVAPSETAIGNNFGFYGLLMDGIKEKNGLKFRVNILNKATDVTLGADLQWTVEKITDPEKLKQVTSCANETSYSFGGGTLHADKTYCVGKEGGVTIGDYIYKFDYKTGPTKINKNTLAQAVLTPQMSPADYTPFDNPDWSKPQLNKLISFEKNVYYCTTRGLWNYDTEKDSWKLISTIDGLPSNEVQNFVFAGNKIFVLTPAGITVIAKP